MPSLMEVQKSLHSRCPPRMLALQALTSKQPSVAPSAKPENTTNVFAAWIVENTTNVFDSLMILKAHCI